MGSEAILACFALRIVDNFLRNHGVRLWQRNRESNLKRSKAKPSGRRPKPSPAGAKTGAAPSPASAPSYVAGYAEGPPAIVETAPPLAEPAVPREEIPVPSSAAVAFEAPRLSGYYAEVAPHPAASCVSTSTGRTR